MTDCREARDLMQDGLDGRLSASDAARLAEHVANCASCSDEKRGLASLRATFRAMPRPAAPAGFRDGVMSSLPKGRVRNLPLMVGWIAAAAALIVVAVTLIPNSRVAERDVAAVRQEAARRAAPSADEESATLDKAAGARDAPVPSAPAPAPPAVAAKKADAAAAPATRYVVFRDAAAAEQFAMDLAAGDVSASKDEAAAQGFGHGAAEARNDAAGDVVKEAATATRRVVARTSVAGPVADAEFAARAARAGGTLVSVADTSQFAAVVEQSVPDAGAAVGPKAESGARARKAAGGPAAAGGAAKSAPPPVVVVIVVLSN